MEFTQDNSVALVVDSPDSFLLDEYGKIAREDRDNLLTVWIRLLTERRSLKIDDHEHTLAGTSDRLFEFVSSIGNDVGLVVWQKSSWTSEHSKFPGVELLDRRDAKAAIHRCLNNSQNGAQMKAPTTNFNFNFADNASANIGNVGGEGGQGSVAIGSNVNNELNSLRQMLPSGQQADVDDLQKQLASPKPNPDSVRTLWDRILKVAPAATGLTSLAVLVGKILAGV